SMLLGGVAFGTPPHAAIGERADSDTGFRLYPDEKAALKPSFERRQQWRMAFAGSVRGLLPGAPVEFRGIRIGEVDAIQLQLDADEREAHIPVTVWIEPERLGIKNDTAGTDKVSVAERELWDRLVRNGLRAQLKTGSLITSALYIDLDFYPDDPQRQIVWGAGVPELPTVQTPLDELRGLLSRLSRLPLDRMGEDLSQSLEALRETMQTTNVLMERLDRETVSELNKTLEQTRRTLISAEKVLSPNSALQSEAHRVLQELGSAARSFRIMADYLERHPEAIIRGKGADTQ
ncbi:MAG: MlaD family protein, partial [Sedimenticolaceae bacterium]